MDRLLRNRMLCVLAGIGCLYAASVTAATQTQIDTARVNGLAWLYQHQRGDGGWADVPELEVQSTSAVLIALLNAGVQKGNTYNAAVSRLANLTPTSVDGLSRQAAVLKKTGVDASALVTQLQASGNLYKAWGALPGYGSSPADTSLALSALLDALPSYTNNDILTALCAAILPTQRSGGGWSYLGGGSSAPATATGGSIIPTAYTILLLQKINATRFTGVSCPTSYTLATSINNGVSFLLTKKNADNGFGEDGTSGALETALAYTAIQAVNPSHTALGPAQDYLVGSQQSNGSWANDPLQTALVLQTFPVTTLTDTAQDGIPDVVKTALSIGTVASERALRPGNGQGVAGTNSSLPLTDVTLSQLVNYSLSTTGGTPPYTYSLLSGRLPDGLTLASNGTISGSPGTVGQFNFTYEVVDSTGAAMAVAGAITVNAPVTSTAVPALPAWGMILMSIMLLSMTIIVDRRRWRRD